MEWTKKLCTRTHIRSVRAPGSVSQPVRSLRALNPPTRMSKANSSTPPDTASRRYEERRSSRSRQENQEGTPHMHFEAKKVMVVGGSAGIGRQVAIDIVDHGGGAAVARRPKDPVAGTPAHLPSPGG